MTWFKKQTKSDVDITTGKSLDIESGATLKIAGVTVTSDAADLNKISGGNPVLTVYGSATAAEVKAGKVIVPLAAGVQLKLVHATLQAVGGAAGTSTSVDIKDTSETALIAFPIALLTQDEIVDSGASATIVASTIAAAVTSGRGLMIQDTAKNNLTGATSISYVVQYSIV